MILVAGNKPFSFGGDWLATDAASNTPGIRAVGLFFY